jgi:lipopolysaccharide export system protein LptC
MATAPGLYSRVVAVLKVGLPLVALGMLAALFLIQTEDRLAPGLRFTEGDLAALGEGLRISNPTFTGTTRDGAPFRFTAEFVVPDAAPPTRAAIIGLQGELELPDGPTIRLDAAGGDLDLERQVLVLEGDVRVTTSDGYRLASERMTLDLAAGTLEAGDAVVTEGPLGRIDSGSLAIAPSAAGTDETHRFSFGDGVRVVYDPPPTTE